MAEVVLSVAWLQLAVDEEQQEAALSFPGGVSVDADQQHQLYCLHSFHSCKIDPGTAAVAVAHSRPVVVALGAAGVETESVAAMQIRAGGLGRHTVAPVVAAHNQTGRLVLHTAGCSPADRNPAARSPAARIGSVAAAGAAAPEVEGFAAILAAVTADSVSGIAVVAPHTAVGVPGEFAVVAAAAIGKCIAAVVVLAVAAGTADIAVAAAVALGPGRDFAAAAFDVAD